MRRQRKLEPKNLEEEIILEWTNEGSEYLYEEQPERIKKLEEYLDKQIVYVNKLYRATNNEDILNAKINDIINLSKITSWSLDPQMPESRYEGRYHKLIIIEKQKLRGRDVSNLSPYPNEREILLAPCSLFIINKDNHILQVKYINEIIDDNEI